MATDASVLVVPVAAGVAAIVQAVFVSMWLDPQFGLNFVVASLPSVLIAAVVAIGAAVVVIVRDRPRAALVTRVGAALAAAIGIAGTVMYTVLVVNWPCNTDTHAYTPWLPFALVAASAILWTVVAVLRHIRQRAASGEPVARI